MRIDPCYASCIHGPMNAVQTYQMDSIENTNKYIQLFEQAIANGLNPNNAEVQEQIFSQGNLDYDSLTPTDKARLNRAVEAAYNAYHTYN